MLCQCTHLRVASSRSSTVRDGRGRGQVRSFSSRSQSRLGRCHTRRRSIRWTRRSLPARASRERHSRRLRARVAVMYQTVHGRVTGKVASPQAHSQRSVTGGVVFTVAACQPTIARVAVDHERHVSEPRPRRDISEIRGPAAVRRLGGEVPIEQIRGTIGMTIRDRGPHPPPPDQTGQPEIAHQPVHLPLGYHQAAAPQVSGHLPPPI